MQLRSDFITQCNLNGTGVSINYGTIGREFLCLQSQYNPPQDAPNISFRRGATIHGAPACGGAALTNLSLAVGPDNPDGLDCGNTVYIAGVGVKTLVDLCPACNGDRHLDNYTTDPACHHIPDVGNLMTIQVYP